MSYRLKPSLYYASSNRYTPLKKPILTLSQNFTQLLPDYIVRLLFGTELNLMGNGLGYGFQLLTYALLSKLKCVSPEKFFK
jgi:hypothetical protein